MWVLEQLDHIRQMGSHAVNGTAAEFSDFRAAGARCKQVAGVQLRWQKQSAAVSCLMLRILERFDLY